jgi:hypothetical protein
MYPARLVREHVLVDPGAAQQVVYACVPATLTAGLIAADRMTTIRMQWLPFLYVNLAFSAAVLVYLVSLYVPPRAR